MPHEGLYYPLLFGAGIVAGALNVVAGGGSFLTLPILILMGMPATMANGTNRIGILLQNVAAVIGFRRHGLIERAWLVRAALPATLGAIGGTLIALRIDDRDFERILAFLMVAVTIWTLWDPLRGRSAGPGEGGAQNRPPAAGGALVAAGFFTAGLYGGFVQAGVGFLLLAAATLAGCDLVRGNALKVFCVLVSTPISLALFLREGQVAWLPGLALAAGSMVGAGIGVRLTIRRGHRWIRGVVTVVVILLAVKLWFGG
jgi:uncharacterized membrane protein YfcA